MQEKTVAYTILNHPDYESIIHAVLSHWDWKTEAFGQFLKDHENMITELFAADQTDSPNGETELGKHHNIRCLIAALECFHRIYYHMTRAQVPDMRPYLCSYLTFCIAAKCGIIKNGKNCYDPTDEEISLLYAGFSSDTLFESVRRWIQRGYWDKELFFEELSRISPIKPLKDTGSEANELG